MFTSDKRARKRLGKTEGIIEAAARLVEEGGLEGLTIHKLAKELDVVPGGLYRYFPSMSALSSELQCRIIREYHDAQTNALQHLPASAGPLLRILFLARYYRRWFLARPGKLGLIAMSMSDPRRLFSDEENARVVAEAGAVLFTLIALFDEAAEKGDLSDGPGPMRALAYWAAIQGVLGMRKMRFGAAPPEHEAAVNEELLDTATTTLLLGFGASAAKVKNAAKGAAKHLENEDANVERSSRPDHRRRVGDRAGAR